MLIEQAGQMKKVKDRSYNSPVRQQQADETRKRILSATRELFRSHGLVKTTISAVAKRARVAEPTIYATFKSKQGLLAAVIDYATFGPAYDELVLHAASISEPEQRLRALARIARRVHESTTAELDIILAEGDHSEVAQFEAEREERRFELQRGAVELIVKKKGLQKDLQAKAAQDILWAMTGRDIFRLLTRVRGWTGDHYEEWLGGALCTLLLK